MDGQFVPPSAGWQLKSVDISAINLTTDYSDSRPHLRKQPAGEARRDPEYYGLIFILRVERVTR